LELNRREILRSACPSGRRAQNDIAKEIFGFILTQGEIALPLGEYRKKRKFEISPEPAGAPQPPKAPRERLAYVIQKHRATQLHYDFRLEFNGVLMSWAVPKGPSLDPSVKRLAMQVEDHPVEYAAFEGVIPGGEYGGGTVMVWDNGEWEPEVDDVAQALQKGDFKFVLHGKKLRGSWVLVRTRGFGSKPDKSWLLIKHRDKYASTADVEVAEPRSVLSGRLLAEIARDGGGDVEKAQTGDPPVDKPTVAQPARRTVTKKKAKR
jgi:bifunctional non-homologous end joining protein LigD